MVFAALNQLVQEVLEKELSAKDCRNAVEIGCGDGFFTNFLCPVWLRSRMFSFDLNLPSLQKAANESKTDRTNFFSGSAYEIPFHDNSVDAVLGYSSFDSLIGLQEALNEGARVLRPGGKLVLFQDLTPELHIPLKNGVLTKAATIKYHETLLTYLRRDWQHFELMGREQPLESISVEKKQVVLERTQGLPNVQTLIDNKFSGRGIFVLGFDRGETYFIPRLNFIERLVLPSVCRSLDIKTPIYKYFPKKDEVLEWVRMYAVVAKRK